MGIVIGVFSDNIRTFGFSLAALLGIGAVFCLVMKFVQQNDFEQLEVQFDEQSYALIQNEKQKKRDSLGTLLVSDIPVFTSVSATDYPLPSPENFQVRSVWGNMPDLYAVPSRGRPYSSIKLKTLYCSQGWVYGAQEVFDRRQKYSEYLGNIQWPISEVDVSFQVIHGGREIALVVRNSGETWSIYLENSPEEIAHVQSLQDHVRKTRGRPQN
ncbi:hypothetical protein [Actinotignum sp. GS-2025a]|uniref:hypothetical protein n=1 Tax=Actinotignum sp. GS-2025a TaxID=3427274 RepID=UPI003F4521CA